MERRLPGTELLDWLTPFGLSVRLLFSALSWPSIRNLSWREIRVHCRWMGLGSFYLVVLSAVVVAIALLLQLVIELQKYRIHDFAGGIISIGLLREIGPLTVGLAWCARIAARVSEDAHSFITHSSELELAQKFILPRCVAALLMALPLSTYGLVVGFLTAAFFAPILSVSSTNTFLESAQQVIENKDLIAYFAKLMFVFPFIAVLAGSACGMLKGRSCAPVAMDAVTATFISTFIANLMVTVAIFYHG